MPFSRRDIHRSGLEPFTYTLSSFLAWSTLYVTERIAGFNLQDGAAASPIFV